VVGEVIVRDVSTSRRLRASLDKSLERRPQSAVVRSEYENAESK
jgi:hypothetical protein